MSRKRSNPHKNFMVFNAVLFFAVLAITAIFLYLSFTLKRDAEKKKTYEEVLQRQLDDLNSDYRLLQMQSQELYVRNVQGQMKMVA